MFSNFFGNKKSSPTGFFKVINNELDPIGELPGKGSIEDVIESLGYRLGQVYTIFTFDSNQISCIGVKIFTKKVVFVLAENKSIKLSMASVNNELSKIDWGFQYSSHSIDEIFDKGISEQSLTYKFLDSVIELKPEYENIFWAPIFELYLYFEDNLLIEYSTASWLSADSKWLKEINDELFQDMFSEANTYHENEIEAFEEVNLQCAAMRGIPDAMGNKFLPYHRKTNGLNNYYNLLAAHYNQNIEIGEFKLVNNGRFTEINKLVLEVSGFQYIFNDDGYLVEVIKA